MEYVRCHGVTTEVPAGLSDEERVAFIENFTAEQVALHEASVVEPAADATDAPADAHQED